MRASVFGGCELRFLYLYFRFLSGEFQRPGWPQLESVEGTVAAMRSGQYCWPRNPKRVGHVVRRIQKCVRDGGSHAHAHAALARLRAEDQLPREYASREGQASFAGAQRQNSVERALQPLSPVPLRRAPSDCWRGRWSIRHSCTCSEIGRAPCSEREGAYG